MEFKGEVCFFLERECLWNLNRSHIFYFHKDWEAVCFTKVWVRSVLLYCLAEPARSWPSPMAQQGVLWCSYDEDQQLDIWYLVYGDDTLRKIPVDTNALLNCLCGSSPLVDFFSLVFRTGIRGLCTGVLKRCNMVKWFLLFGWCFGLVDGLTISGLLGAP